jgi:acylphosphatase
MVEKRFCVTGDSQKIFDVGLRAGLIGKAGDYNIKLHTDNMLDNNEVKITASGSYDNVTTFYQYVKNNDVRAEKNAEMYKVTELLDCDAAEINYTNYHESFASEQQGKTRFIAQKMLSSININGKTSEEKLSSIEKQITLMADALENIGTTLKSIDEKTLSKDIKRI